MEISQEITYLQISKQKCCSTIHCKHCNHQSSYH